MFEIKFSFTFAKDLEKTFTVVLDDNLEVDGFTESRKPDWALLKNFRCEICSLDEQRYKYCPVLLNLNKAVSFFTGFPSYEKVQLTVETPQRNYEKKTTVQDALSSMAGILMAGSCCPVMSKLKPLIKFHLPFATIEETSYRALSMYLVAQYLRQSNGEKPDWELKEMDKLYKQIQIVNATIAELLTSLEEKDTGKNAVIVLNNFASFLALRLEDGKFSELEGIFKEYLSNHT